MIERLTYDGTCVYVHAADTSLKTTKAFTHGTIVFDTALRMVVFGNLDAVAIPEDLILEAGKTLNFQLVAPNGKLRPQTRSSALLANEKQPGLLRIAGMSKTPRRFAVEDGWGNAIFKYRAYFTHPGIDMTAEGEFKKIENLPEWLRDCIIRQKALWNRLAWLCRDARRKCSPVLPEQIAEFVANTILPEIDAFNLTRGRDKTKEKMRHPAKLKIEAPGVDGLWSFVGELRGRIEKKLPVPDGLLEKVVAYAEQFKADYTPLNEFTRDFSTIAEKEAVALGLKRFEIRPTVSAFKAVLDRRKTTAASWSEGWPLIKYPDSPKAGNWGIHYYFNKAGVESELFEIGNGIPGMTAGPAFQPAGSGRGKKTINFFKSLGSMSVVGTVTKRALRPVEISIPAEKGERWNFHFSIMEHRALPLNSHIKEWKLIYQDGKLWLCLVVELQRPIPKKESLAAGLEIGWRRTEEGIRFATLYEPATKSICEATINFQRSPRDQKDRVPFCIDLGPTRWEKRHIGELLPDWKPGDAIPNVIELRMALAARRDYLKDTAKILLRKHLGEKTPTWLEKAGSNGLHKLAQEFLEDTAVQTIVNEWEKNNRRITELLAFYFAQTTKRLEYAQLQVAHDICKHLQAKGIGRLIVEDSFLSKVAQRHDNEDPESLKRSQKYRQFAAPGKFILSSKMTALSYGIAVERHANINLTCMCHYCNYLNPSTELEKYNCEGCGREIKQDHNTAINLVRFDSDPDLAQKALQDGSKA
jgi:hypothetical protein